jgi:hypothetical protein
MSFKTDRLTSLLPDAYGATETESLLYRLIDAFGAELMAADDRAKRLLKSHWVDYAEGAALDGLGATFAVARRSLPDGSPEVDDAYRRRLRAVVPLFTGGGTKRAITGAVQSALGLPFDLDTLGLPRALRDDLAQLVMLEEFPATDERLDYGPERLVVERIAGVGEEAALYVDIVAWAAEETALEIVWTMVAGGALDVTIERLGGERPVGVRSEQSLLLPPDTVVRFRTDPNRGFSAVIDGGPDLSHRFVGLDGGRPELPAVPIDPSTWRFSARGARLDTTRFDTHFDTTFVDVGARFDEMTFDVDGHLDATPDDGEPFDLPRFSLGLSWRRPQPLCFDLTVPWTARTAVDAVLARHGYRGDVFVFAGLGHDAIKRVVEQTRAAGVRANLYFSVYAAEDHGARDAVELGTRQAPEDAGASDTFRLDGVSGQAESHDAEDRLGLAADFDVARFDGQFVFT